MIVHICCSVDSHYFLKRLQIAYPDEKLVGFFYNPNIHPYSEYKLRLQDVQRSCKMLNIELIEGEYDYRRWLEVVKGFENEPEKGKRCEICFDNRLENTAKLAKELNHKSMTTTLLMSPKKSIEQLQIEGLKISNRYHVEFIVVDFRKKGGTQEQFALAKKDKLYKQNYCGCLYGLKQQREITSELFSNIANQTQMNSIEEKTRLYKDIKKCQLIKEKFLNYRLLRAYVKVDKIILPSYFLVYSTMKNKSINARVEFTKDDIMYLNKENIKFISLKHANKILKTSYKSVKEMIFNPPSIKNELKLRNNYDLSPIIILDELQDKRYEIYLDAVTFFDVREIIDL